ncbi:FkbM family methyltransferase [Puniceicoccaceae bacterium]|nr:FkbM family methyltransferase [Puniceicoccaceae bacterium]
MKLKKETRKLWKERRRKLNWLRRFSETVGIPKWTRRPALYEMDHKLSKYLNFRNGFFVEAGANDGFTQSNTFFLEKGLNWKGVLVEAIPDLFEKCKAVRTRSTVVNGGLVPRGYKQDTLTMHYANLMSIAAGAMEATAMENHIQTGLACQAIDESYSIDVPAITFEDILHQAKCPQIDFLSIDLEGFELEALKGWDFEKHRPRYILTEVRDLPAVDDFFTERNYEQVALLSIHDYLYQDMLN